ncbi:uncharacterized protein LOC119168375 [Rhipicephalus microplus]|uniref:uncharacterized protein LOC119168375 n=1 Tax=Rhipicephalus microplus TaxID=6941 RepID=UPI003F6B8226
MASPPSLADETADKTARVKYTRHQLDRLEEEFNDHQFIDSQETLRLSAELGISAKQIRTWFQNKRAMLRRLAIRAAGSNYVPQLQRPAAQSKARTPPASPRGAGDSRPSQPAAVPSAFAVDNPGVQAQCTAGTEFQPQQRVPPHGSFPAGGGYLTVPQPRWNDRMSPTVPSSPSPAVSSGDEEALSASVELRPNVAANPYRPYGSVESIWPDSPPPPLTSSFSHSAPCITAGRSPTGHDCIRYRQAPYSTAAAPPMWQAQPQWQQVVQPPQGPPPPPVHNVQTWSQPAAAEPPQGPPPQVHKVPEGVWTQPEPAAATGHVLQGTWVPSPWQPTQAGASAPPAEDSHTVPDIGSLTALVLEMEATAISGRNGGAGNS